MPVIKSSGLSYEVITSESVKKLALDLADSLDNYVDFEQSVIIDGKSVTENFVRIPVFFDTETTVYNEHSYIYIAQFNYNNTYYIARTIDVFYTLFIEMVKHMEKSVYMGIHNIGFDWSHMSSELYLYCVANGVKYEVLSDKPHSPITVNLINKENHGIHIVDTARIFNMSLEKVGEKYTHSKKAVGKLDYSKIRNSLTPLSDDELDYSLFDVIVGGEAMEWLYSNFTDKGKQLPITSTSMVRQLVKENYKNENWYKNENEDFKQYAPVSVNKKGVYKLDCEKYFPFTYQEYSDEFINYLFRGGYTHGNVYYFGETVENVTCVDYTSSYPAVMLHNKFPLSPFKKIGKINLDKYCDGKNIIIPVGNDVYAPYNVVDKCYIMTVTFKNIHSISNHSLESENKAMNVLNENFTVIDNGRIYSTDKLTVMLTELDYQNYCNMYEWDTVELLNLKWSYKGKLPNYLLNVMKKAYKDKATLKREKQSYEHEKAIVNSTYGMCVQRLNLTSYIGVYDYDNDWLDTTVSDYGDRVKQMCTNKVNELYSEYTAKNPDMSEDEKQNRLHRVIENIYTECAYREKSRTRILNCYWGLYISAYARNNLVTMLSTLENENPDCVIYYDTDSLYIKDIETVKHHIEKWNTDIMKINHDMFNGDSDFIDVGCFDYDDTCTRFKHLGAKRYIKEIHGELKSTIAGLKKNYFTGVAKEVGNDKAFEMFTTNMVVDKFTTGKLSALYYAEKTTDDVIDYMGNSCTMHSHGGCVLSPAPFNLLVLETNYILHDKVKK